MEDKSIFVGREPELAILSTSFHKALESHGQILFLTGDAGAGKSTLVMEFVRQIQAKNEDLAVAVGSCDAQTGSGDPYLPFREIFEQLTADLEKTQDHLRTSAMKENARVNSHRLKKLAVLTGDLLVNLGPDLVDLFLPGVKILATAGKLALNKTGWADKFILRLEHKPVGGKTVPEGLDQAQIFEQYINFLQALSNKIPIVLILEDLHWADADSLGLLFRLGRRLEGMRLMIIGTFRPSDIALGRDGQRHPMEQVLNEMKRYFGEIEIDLDHVRVDRGREFVNQYLNSELNCLDEPFREALFRHTGGHPLFTAELVRHLQENGHLVQDGKGCWQEGPGLNWDDLPSRVEGIFEERIGRLTNELRDRLTVASVEGEQFTAEVVARVKAIDIRILVGQLSGELEKEHHLLESMGVERIGLQRVSHYHFSHYLLQAYMYNKLDKIELSYLHEDVGNALEELYGEKADSIAVQLARHFGLAGETEKTRHYLQLAGEQAAAGFANRQAVEYFTNALALTSIDDHDSRTRLLFAREQIYELLVEHNLQEKDLAELQKLAEQSGNPGKLAEVALRFSQLALARADYQASIQAAENAVAQAEKAGDQAQVAAGHRLWGSGLREKGEYEKAGGQFEMARALAETAHADQVWARSLHELGAIAYFKSDYLEARTYWQKILDFYRQRDDRRGQSLALRSLGIAANQMGEYGQARLFTLEALKLTRAVGDRQEESRCLTTLANTARHEGDLKGAQQFYEQALEMYKGFGNRAWEGLGLMNLGYVIWEQGNFRRALPLLEQALAIQQEIGNRWAEASCLENLGMVTRDLGNPKEAWDYFQRGLTICREMGLRDDETSMLIEAGIAAEELNDSAGSLEAFQLALIRAEELGQHQAKVEAQAGLAQADLRSGKTAESLARIADLLDYLANDPTMAGSQQPFRIHLICYRVLKMAGDGQAINVLLRAHRLLQEKAAKIPEADVRKMFLENIIVHRELVKEYEQFNAKKPVSAQ